MALTGFDPDLVNRSISSVKKAYEDLIKALGDDMQNQFIVGMSDKWACNQAQKFFNEAFKPAIDNLINGANKTFESVVAAMNSAAQAWAQQTESSYSPQSFTVILKAMDTSMIMENIGGVRGIDLATSSSIVAKLSVIAEAAKNALTAAQQAVQNCGFIGGNQEANLVNSLGIIKTNIDNATQEVTTQTKDAIQNTIEVYSDTEGKVSQAFASGN